MTKSHLKVNHNDKVTYDFPIDAYKSFMTAYVQRINEATFRVPIGGVRIGTAKYSRLAQINLKSRVITFSRYAIESVPERGRRYLVLHELAHTEEPTHNKHFWSLVERHEPNYKKIDKELEEAFKRNVEAELKRQSNNTTCKDAKNLLYQPLLFPVSIGSSQITPVNNQTDSNTQIDHESSSILSNQGLLYPFDAGILEDDTCVDNSFSAWDTYSSQTVYDNNQPQERVDDSYFDH